MLVLLTDVAHDRFWPLVARPGVEPLIMDRGAQLVLADGSRVERERADAEVAWGTSDLFGDGAPLRPFLGMVRRAPSLRWFQSPAAGFDEPFFADLVRRGVLVTNAHVNGIPIAEFVLRAVLDHFQAAHLWRAAESGHQWKLHDYREVAGTTWLVIGLGSIGGGVARRAAAFGARVIGCRRHPRPDDPTDRTVTLDELPEVIGEADVVILCAPATSETRGIVGEEFLRHMKPASLIVNVGRRTPFSTSSPPSPCRPTTPSGTTPPSRSPRTMPPGAPAATGARRSCSRPISTGTWAARTCSTM